MGAPQPQRIPWAAVRDWCAFHDLPGESVPLLDAICGELDGVFFERHRMLST